MDIHIHHHRRSGCGGLLVYWLFLTVVYMLTGIAGVWVVLGIGAVVILVILGRALGRG